VALLSCRVLLFAVWDTCDEIGPLRDPDIPFVCHEMLHDESNKSVPERSVPITLGVKCIVPDAL
jgi:hypothetical protein